MIRPKKLAHVVLRVRDICRSERFYTGVLRLKVTARLQDKMVFMSASEDSSHELALLAIGADALNIDSRRVGLYHFAWEMKSFEELRDMYGELKEKGIEIAGVGDHGISIGVYFFDPDGNEVEIVYELPREQWPDRDIFGGRFPRSLEEEPVPR